MALPPVYSYQLLQGEVTSGSFAESTVPAGFQWVITDISGGLSAFTVDAVDALFEADGQEIYDPFAPPFFTRQLKWRGRVVIPPGSNLSCSVGGHSGAGSASFIVSGYQLSLP